MCIISSLTLTVLKLIFFQPHVRVWNSVSLATLAVIGAGQMERGVAAISFSRADGGALLACVDDGQDHTISVWEWQRDKGHCLAETKVRSRSQWLK